MNKIYLICVLVHLIQLCVSKSPGLTLQMLSSGDVVSLRSRLTGHVETDRLNNFLDSIYKLREDAPKGDGAKAYKELFALIFASKSTTSQEDWLKILSGDKSKLTQTEIQEIERDDEGSNKKENFILIKRLLPLRLNESDASHFIDNLNKFSSFHTIMKGRRDLLISALASAAEKPESEVQRWVTLI